jgi:demethylmenaquinone methyltransferase/2-methoxy-6-polyprenyl-1,4-benzoquinol methylase
MPSLDHFGIIAPFYDRTIPLKAPQHLIELIGLPIEGAILDAGGGTGRVAQAFEHLAARVVVVETSTPKRGVMASMLGNRIPAFSGCII